MTLKITITLDTDREPIIKRVTVETMRGNNHVTATADTFEAAMDMARARYKEIEG